MDLEGKIVLGFFGLACLAHLTYTIWKLIKMWRSDDWN